MQQTHPKLSRLLALVSVLIALLEGCSISIQFTGPIPFNRAEAFTLAQETQAERQALPIYRGNYGGGSITVFYGDGIQRYPSPIYQGYDAPTPPVYTTHSEQMVYMWIYDELPQLRQQHIFNGATSVRIVIFSQVIVCGDCRTAMIPWQRELRARAGTNTLFVTVWQLTPGKAGFNPKTMPRGRPVTDPSDVQQVNIPFA